MKFLFLLLAGTLALPAFAYNDHRGHNLDSLEREVGRWTPDALDAASIDEKIRYNRDCRDLMLGFSTLNGEKCVYYARKALSLSEREGWEDANADAYRYIGQCFWGGEQYDSALVYYRKALGAVDRMAASATSPTNPEGYTELDIDDTRSALYGAIGNLYNMKGDIPAAMQWYDKAGAIFDRYGWDQSNAILYYNIGETWMEQDETDKAYAAYEKSLRYGQGDSLRVAMAQKGLGRCHMVRGETRKALEYLQKADEYFSTHEQEEMTYRKETFEYMSQVLLAQRRQLMWAIIGAGLLLFLTGLAWWLSTRLRHMKKGKEEAAEIINETLNELRPRQQEIILTEREREVLDLLSKGYTTPQIASGLHLSAETIRWYRKKLLVKFDVSNTPELISQAKEEGLI